MNKKIIEKSAIYGGNNFYKGAIRINGFTLEIS